MIKKKKKERRVNNPISVGISSSTTKKKKEGQRERRQSRDINSNRANIKKPKIGEIDGVFTKRLKTNRGYKKKSWR